MMRRTAKFHALRLRAIRFLPVMAFSILALPILSACASQGQYPSLARRDVERIGGTAMPAGNAAPAAPALPPPGASLLSRVDGLLSAARTAHSDFSSHRSSAERAVAAASGAATTSDSWIDAQVALSGLQAARSGAMTALAELDQLYVEERIAVTAEESPSAQAIGSARTQVEGWVAEEDSVIAGLARRLGS